MQDVPAVFAVNEDGYVGAPVDRITRQASSRLHREDNLQADPRAALLVEHGDTGDWSRLWWVRAALRHVDEPPPALTEERAARLARTIPGAPTSPSIACWCVASSA